MNEVLEYIRTNPHCYAPEIAQALKMDIEKVTYAVKTLKEQRLIWCVVGYGYEIAGEVVKVSRI